MKDLKFVVICCLVVIATAASASNREKTEESDEKPRKVRQTYGYAPLPPAYGASSMYPMPQYQPSPYAAAVIPPGFVPAGPYISLPQVPTAQTMLVHTGPAPPPRPTMVPVLVPSYGPPNGYGYGK